MSIPAPDVAPPSMPRIEDAPPPAQRQRAADREAMVDGLRGRLEGTLELDHTTRAGQDASVRAAGELFAAALDLGEDAEDRSLV